MPSWKKVIVSGSDAALNSLNITGALTASGLIYPTTDPGEFSFLQSDGNGNLSLEYVNTIYESIYNGELTQITKGTPLYVSGAVGAESVVYRADAGDPTKMPVTYIAADNINSLSSGKGIVLGLITGVDTTGYGPGTEIYVGVGGGWTSTRPTGSATAQLLGIVTKEGPGGQGLVLNPGPYNTPNLESGQIFWADENDNVLKKSLSDIFSGSAYVYSGSFSGSFVGDGSQLSGVSSYADSDTLAYINTLGVVSSSAQISTEISGAFTSLSASIANDISSISTDFADITNKPTLLSGSAQIASEISGAFISTSASLASNIASNDSRLDILEGKTLVSGSIQIDHDQTTNFIANEHIDHSSVTITAGDGLTGGGDITTSRTLDVDSTVARTNANNSFTGTQTFVNLIVNGTGSFAYIQQVTGSAKVIGDAYIILNADSPTERYAGLKVYDSGSSDTGSLEYDSANNHWFYESTTEGYASGLISGPRDSRGSITFPTNNTLVKGIGGNHIDDSSITDDGSLVTISSDTSIVGTLSATTIQNVISSSAQVDYDSIQNQPTIPTNNNQLTNGAGYTTCVGDITGVTAGVGLSGGGTTGDVSLAVDLSELTDMTATMAGTDEFIVLDGGEDRRKAANEIGLSIFNNDSSFTSCTGTVTSVGGTGTVNGLTLTGTVTSTGNLTLGGTLGSITVSQLDGAAVQTSAESFSDSDTVLMTAAAIEDRITGKGYTTCTGDITGVTAGTGITGGGTSGTVTINHSDTSTLNGAYGTNGVSSITVDSLGHVTAVSTATYSNCQGTVTSVATGTGLTGGTITSTGTISLSHLGLESLTDPNADRVAFWDDSAGAFAWLTMGSNLSISGTTLNATDTNTTYSAATMLTCIKTVDGASSGLDADLLDGNEASAFYLATNPSGYTTCVGDITGVTAGTGLSGGGTSGTVTVNVNSDQRGSIVLIGQDTNDYIHVNTTVIDFRLDGNLDMRLENDGDLHVDGDVIAYSTTTSDIRFKDNINTIENSLDKIKAIRGVEFVWNAGGRKGEYDLGVIAQEVEEVIPSIVREKKLPMFDTSDTLYKTVDYEKLIPLLIESVKELSNQIEYLKNNK